VTAGFRITGADAVGLPDTCALQRQGPIGGTPIPNGAGETAKSAMASRSYRGAGGPDRICPFAAFLHEAVPGG